MKGDNQKRNEKKIERAFKRLFNLSDSVFRKAMEDMCKEAMQYALELHDERHSLHTKIGDSYGWVVLHDGAVVSSDVNAGQGFDNHEDFHNGIKTAIPAEYSSKGWVGVIVAGMSAIGYYSVDFENDVLNNTKDFVRDNFVSIVQHYAKSNIK